MAQISHVPKFGNWENDDVPYTAYFDNARKDKPGGHVVRINPNDPEEDPEAFMAAMTRVHRMPMESEAPDHHHHHHNNSHAGAVPTQQPLRPPPARRTMSSGKRHDGADELTGQSHRTRHHRDSSGTGSGSGIHQITSESGHSINYTRNTAKSSSDYSLLRRPGDQGRQRSRANIIPDKRKSRTTSSSQGSEFSSSYTPDKGHRRDTSNGSNNQYSSDHHQHHHRAASIPKFGAWDVNDPKSGEGFTFIFDKLKEEKHVNATGKVPNMSPPPPNNYLKDQRKRSGRSSCASKICCCLFPSGSE